MTANLVRWDPSGTQGADVVNGGGISIVKAGSGTVKYEQLARFNRGSGGMGVQITSSTDTADQTQALLQGTADNTARAQVYFSIPVPGTGTIGTPIFDIRSSTGNLIRAAVNQSLQLTCQNAVGTPPGGALNGTLATLTAGTVYRLELSVDPGTSTTGIGSLGLWRNDDTVIVDPTVATISNGNFGTTLPDRVRFGDSAVAANQLFGYTMNYTQMAIDTDAVSPPSIDPVDLNPTPIPAFTSSKAGQLWG